MIIIKLKIVANDYRKVENVAYLIIVKTMKNVAYNCNKTTFI